MNLLFAGIQAGVFLVLSSTPARAGSELFGGGFFHQYHLHGVAGVHLLMDLCHKELRLI